MIKFTNEFGSPWDQDDPRRIVIVDIDGTLSDASHRTHYIDRERLGGRDWDAFYNAAGLDEPIEPVVELVQALEAGGWYIVLMTGRSESISDLTMSWLDDAGVPWSEMYMRPTGNHAPDHWVKRAAYEHHFLGFDRPVMLVLEDRASVVEMWRDLGLRCLQVDEGFF